MRIILASASPRRSDLMKMAGFTFEVRVKNTPETHPDEVVIEDIPLHLAERKAMAFFDEISDDEVIVAADTIVILNGKIFEKPQHREDAIAMLSALSGQTHKVVTGVCLLSKRRQIAFRDETKVTFNVLSENEIVFYVDNYKPYDKAGAYACQEWIGAVAIAKFEGDYFNVVGLPVNKVYQHLKEFGINN
jgi:septum formation protein